MTHTSSTSLVLFGATGDLVAKKIIPALFNLFQKRKLPSAFQIIAFARRELTTEEFQTYVTDLLKAKLPDTPLEELNSFKTIFAYHRGKCDTTEDFDALQIRLTEQNNRLFYLAVPPELTQSIFKNLGATGLAVERTDGWTRVIVEKPIGNSGQDAERIEELLCTTFTESQIYRIDHYLAKEMVQNILTFRFSNSLFEQNWNAHGIESIDIKLWERQGVETRGPFYESLGALRDVGQNHLLQMLAFVTMDHPRHFTAEAIRNNRAELLKTLHIPTAQDISTTTFRAQYNGYRTIPGVAATSATETYFKIKTALDTPRWKGVPITMESGKRMGESRKEITVTYRAPETCLCPGDADEHQKNTVTFALEPTEGIRIQFWSKKPGHELLVEKSSLDFMLREPGTQAQYVEEYEKLFLDCINGDQTLFVNRQEVEAMWRFIDPIVRAWKEDRVPLETYPPDTNEISLTAGRTISSPSPASSNLDS